MHTVRQWIHAFVQPRSLDEDRARREFILNILLSGSIALILLGIGISSLHSFTSDDATYNNNSLSLIILFVTLGFFLSLYALSRRGFITVAASLLLSVLFLLAAFMGYKWGVDLQAAILFLILIIVMAGVLIGSRSAFVVTFGIGVFLFALNYAQRMNFVPTNRYWRTNMWGVTDVMVTTLIFFVIAAVSWLSNREITRALARARMSEADLKKERDSLEVKVEERTQELKVAQMEKMAQLYRFAEFGRLSSGLFHDLTNHLSALSLNVEQAHREAASLAPTATQLDQAMRVSEKMKQFITTIRKQISGEQRPTTFSLNDEIKETIQLLDYKARLSGVTFEFDAPFPVYISGDSTKCHQIITNLLANAIDAYVQSPASSPHRVLVTLAQKKQGSCLTITDWGSGIPESIRAKIFEPFFTTKDFSRGTGLGLSLTKRIVEKDFGGTITVESEEGRYTTFTIVFPVSLYVSPTTSQPSLDS